MTTTTETAATDHVYDLLVVGGGVVGLAVLRAATLEGWTCALVEKEEHLLSWASGSNSGIVCTGVDASPGTLERALLRDSISRIRIFCHELNVPKRECGSLVCRWPWDDEGPDRLEHVLRESHEAGDTHACYLSPTEIREREPHMNPSCLGAVLIPGEIVVDPWLFSIAFVVHARQNGAQIFTNFEMDPSSSSFVGSIWTVRRVTRQHDEEGCRQVPDQIRAKAVVNASGLWSDLLQKQVHSTTQWTAKPRRGQYRVYTAAPHASLTHPIQPIPTQRTKGIFVFATLYDQIVVGPTALDQSSRTDRSVDPAVSDELANHVLRMLPSLDTKEAYAGDYVGIRPGTDKRDYQIHLNVQKKWVACAGIRSTGLTAGLGIGRHVVYLLKQGVLEEVSPPSTVRTIPLPDMKDLAYEFNQRGDECVFLDGHIYKVTHPITKFGWKALAKKLGAVKEDVSLPGGPS